jgi:hypothetical protein
VTKRIFRFGSNHLEITRERLFVPNIARRLRVVAISDVHARARHQSIAELIDVVNAESPDIFILAGDTIDRRGDEGLVGMFTPVQAKCSKLAILGNWEHAAELDLAKLGREYERAGISLLVNAACEVAGVLFIGLDDFLHGAPNYRIFQNIQPRVGPLFVISHCPESFEVLASCSPHPMIVLAGHTHGGQIAPFGLAFVTPAGSGSYVHGWYHKGKHAMYVMRGIGTSGLPFRIGARPEVLFLDIDDNLPCRFIES